MEKTYNPKLVEEQIYRDWLARKAYLPEAPAFFWGKQAGTKKKLKKKPFVIMMPPPNVTGNLHIGHALTFAIEDALVRHKKSQGISALWLPGFDHAGIATQVVVERELKKQGITRHQLGREKFVNEVWNWVNIYREHIEDQLKKLGALPDWSRARFTFDEPFKEAVKEAFVRLYDKGLIYRGERMINWCSRCQTVLSDLEVEWQEEEAKLYYIKYGPLAVATVRPETRLGDTALAVHPNDKRYRAYMGKTIEILSTGGAVRLRVITDLAVDKHFGTGVIKVTPAHDPVDFEIAKRHNLEIRQVIGLDGKINENGGAYQGLRVQEAREKIIQDMEALSLIENIEHYTHRRPYCSRCQTTVEPQVSRQWFIDMKPLAKPLIEAAKRGDIRFVPGRFKKVFLQWLADIQDWCISRQLWWGHQLPVFYCSKKREELKTQNTKTKTEEYIVAKEKPKLCPFCKHCSMVQDEDVLDTWFSSSLWPFATLGWPKKTKDIALCYPTDILETGYDILFFWVARMLMMGKKLTGKIPFRTIYLHGLVRDAKGRKMSKSLGNVVDPLLIINEYGADALRFALLYGNSPGNDLRFDTSHVIGGRNFANKLWNIARFYSLKSQELPMKDEELSIADLDEIDKAFLARLKILEKTVTRQLENFQLAKALQGLHHFVWHEFADTYIEHAKASGKKEKFFVIRDTLFMVLTLLHPFMPFVTEAIYRQLSP